MDLCNYVPEDCVGDGGCRLRELHVEVLVQLLGHLVEARQGQLALELVVGVRAYF